MDEDWDGVYRFDPTPCVDPPMPKVGDRQTLMSSAGVTTLVVTGVDEDGQVTARPAAVDEF